MVSVNDRSSKPVSHIWEMSTARLAQPRKLVYRRFEIRARIHIPLSWYFLARSWLACLSSIMKFNPASVKERLHLSIHSQHDYLSMYRKWSPTPGSTAIIPHELIPPILGIPGQGILGTGPAPKYTVPVSLKHNSIETIICAVSRQLSTPPPRFAWSAECGNRHSKSGDLQRWLCSLCRRTGNKVHISEEIYRSLPGSLIFTSNNSIKCKKAAHSTFTSSYSHHVVFDSGERETNLASWIPQTLLPEWQ